MVKNFFWKTLAGISVLLLLSNDAYPLKINDSTARQSEKNVANSTYSSLAATNQLSTSGYQNQLGIPVGMIVAWGSSGGITTADKFKWLECNGSTFDKNKYPELFAVLGTNVLPNLNNQFLRATTNTSNVLKTQPDSIATHYAKIENAHVTANLVNKSVKTTLNSTALSANLQNKNLTTQQKTINNVRFSVSGTAAGQDFVGDVVGTINALQNGTQNYYVPDLQAEDEILTETTFLQGQKSLGKENYVCGEETREYDCNCTYVIVGKTTETYYHCNRCWYSCGETRWTASSDGPSPECYRFAPSYVPNACAGRAIDVLSTEEPCTPKTREVDKREKHCATCTETIPKYCKRDVTGVTEYNTREFSSIGIPKTVAKNINIANGHAFGTARSSQVTGSANGDVVVPTLDGSLASGFSTGNLTNGLAAGNVENGNVTGTLDSDSVKYAGASNPYSGRDETAPMHTFVRYFIRAIP